MALEDLFDRLIASSVKVARNNSIMPRLVNTDIGANLTAKGGTVDVPVIPEALAPITIVPGPVPPATQRPDVPTVPLTLDFWQSVSFSLTDRDISSMGNRADYLPKQLEASAASLADRIDTTILNNYRGVYGIAGTAGQTPFATSFAEAQEATRVLSTQKTPKMMGRRSLVIDEFAHANAIGLEVLQRVDASGSNITLREAQIGRALGFDWYEDQNMPLHQNSGGGGFQTVGLNPVGAAVLNVAGGGAAPQSGDVFSIAGHTQTYAILPGSTQNVWQIAPTLQVAVPANSAIAFRPSHVVNLAFHEQAFIFASRPVQDAIPEFVTARTWVDDVSGLVLTLEVAREYYQTSFRLSSMWGSRLVQPRFATRILG